MNKSGFLSLRRHGEDIAVVEIDMPGEAVNTLRAQSASEFNRVFDEIAADESICGVVLVSKKRDNFIAGADISMLKDISDASEGERLSTLGQEATHRIAHCKVPVVAAIHGACLGGGLEIALACHARVATDADKTKLGLPEVQLGILPGMGGTVRVVERVGLSLGLDLLLTGRQLSARRALSVGLVQETVPPAVLFNAALDWVGRLRASTDKGASPWQALLGALDPAAVRERALSDNRLGRKVVFDQAKKELLKKTSGNYPAPERILRVVRHGLEKGETAGFAAEAEAFGELVVTPEARALRHVFFCQQAAKKFDGPPSGPAPGKLERLGVIGGGLMGQGIAAVSLEQAGLRVRLKETTPENLTRAVVGVDEYIKQRVQRRRLSKWERLEHLGRLTTTLDDRGLESCDVIIEAVFEDLPLKQRILKALEGQASSSLIFASNTSALPISKIAEHSPMRERVIGLHYFSPVTKMPLLEIITTEHTAPWVVRRAIELGKRQGKTVLVVQDGPGFYTTRILAPYLNEAAHLLVEGMPIELVDEQLTQAGFPVGPFTLLDQIGIDVGHKVGRALHEALGERMCPPADLSQLSTRGRLGKKARRGFYSYATDHKERRPVDISVYEELGLSIPDAKPLAASGVNEPSSVAERCLLMMVNEAAHCLDDGILDTEDAGDLGAIFGLGFPPFLGGPFHFIRERGAKEIVARLERLTKKCGPRFEPAPFLRSLAGEE